MLGDNDTERVSAAAYVTFIVTLTHPRRRCMTPHQHAGYWSRSLRLRPCWVDPAERLPTFHGCENGETASPNYFTAKEWLHQPGLAGRSLRTHRRIKKGMDGWSERTTERQLRQTHRHKNNIKEILIFHEFASLSRMFKHQRRPICKPLSDESTRGEPGCDKSCKEPLTSKKF